MPTSQQIRDFDSVLADKLDAIESDCIARDVVEAQNEEDALPSPYEWTPCAPVFGILHSSISEWLNRDEIDTHKNTVSGMYVAMKQVAAQRDVFEKFMLDTGVEVPKEFYTTNDVLQNYKMGNVFERVFTCSGLFAYLKGIPNSNYSTDDGVTDAQDDVDLYYVGDTGVRGREWLRAEDERDNLGRIISTHTDTIIDNSGISLQSLLRNDEDFATKYNSI